jgi:hypothetical protein
MTIVYKNLNNFNEQSSNSQMIEAFRFFLISMPAQVSRFHRNLQSQIPSIFQSSPSTSFNLKSRFRESLSQSFKMDFNDPSSHIKKLS